MAQIFLTTFLACMFAFTVFGLLAWQVGKFFIRRGLTKHLPEILSKALHEGTGTMHGMDPDAQAAFVELMEAAKVTPPGVIPHLPIITCQCGRQQSVPLELPLQPVLEELGWRVEDRFNGWGCPSCVKDAARCA